MTNLSDEDIRREDTCDQKEKTEKNFDASPAEIENLKQTLEEKENEIKDLKNRWLRAKADLENYKKRNLKKIQEMNRYGGEDLIKDILPVLDNFERALNNIGDKQDPVYEGVNLIYQQFLGILEKHGVKEIKAQGKLFDPRYHDAVMQVEDENYDDNMIAEVFQKGYIYHSKVIRPSMVKVAKNREVTLNE